MNKYRIKVIQQDLLTQSIHDHVYVNKVEDVDVYYLAFHENALLFSSIEQIEQTMNVIKDDVQTKRFHNTYSIEVQINDQWVDVDFPKQIDYLTAL